MSRDEKVKILASSNNIIVEKGHLKTPLDNFWEPLEVS